VTAELRIKAFIKREERISVFEGALLASTAYVNLAADYYSEFADVQPKTEYLSPDGFAAYLNRKKRETEFAVPEEADINADFLSIEP
jgi:hypothetical protein